MSDKGISVLQGEGQTFPPDPKFQKQAHIKNMAEYEEMYKRSVDDPEGFWGEQAEKNLDWSKKWDKVLEWDFRKPEIKWFQGGKLNASVNCLDRHLLAAPDSLVSGDHHVALAVVDPVPEGV